MAISLVFSSTIAVSVRFLLFLSVRCVVKMSVCAKIVALCCFAGLVTSLNISIALGIHQDAFSIVFADPTTTLSKSWLCQTEGFQDAVCDTVISATANATLSATNSTTSSLSFFAEVILIDPLHTTAIDVQRVVSDRRALHELIAQYSTWPSQCGLIDVCTTPNASDTLKSCLQQRIFSGPLNYTNFLNKANRVFANSDSRVLERLTPVGVIPFQVAIFAPVNQSLCIPATSQNESTVEKFKSSPILYAALPGNFSRDSFAKEIQAETAPRGAVRLNCTTPLSWESPKNVSSLEALRSFTEISGDFLETLLPMRPVASNDSQVDVTRRFLPRRDSDWARSTLPSRTLAVLPEMFDWNMSSVALFDNAVDRAVSESRSNIAQRLVLGGNSTLINTTAAPSIQLRTVLCFGMTWASAYSRWPNSSTVTAPQRNVINGSNASSSSVNRRLGDVMDRCINVALNASSPTGGVALPTLVLSMCPSTSTALLPQFYVCSTKRQAMPFEVVLSPLGSSTTRNSSSSGVQQVTAASLQQNVSLLVTMMAEVSAADGTVRRTAPNNSPVLTSTSNYSNYFSANNSDDSLVNSSTPWNPFSVVSLQPQNCFPYAYVLPMPLREANNSASTLHNTSIAGALPGLAAMTTLREQYGVGSFCFASNLLLRATPLDGYCGDNWITGLYASIEQTGLLVTFHQRALSNLSTLYRVSTIQSNVTSGPFCCTASYGGNSTSQCLSGVNSTTAVVTQATTECSSQGCATTTTSSFQSVGSSMSFEGVRKFSGAEATITARVWRCSYDVYRVRRNCTPAVGAYVRMVAIPLQQSDALLSNYAAFDDYVRSSAYVSPFAGLSLVLTNNNGTAVFKEYFPAQCFATRRAAIHFPMKGESTPSINISDAAVTSYYQGISRFETSSMLYLLSRPSPGRCTGVFSQSMVNGALGVPFGPLDVDTVDSCGTHLNGVVKLSAYASSNVLLNPGVSALVSPTALRNSTSLLGVLLRQTIVSIDNQEHVPALFAGISATNNLSNTAGTSGLMTELFMNSDALASMGDVILWSDLDGIPVITASRLNSSCGGNATFLTSSTSSASTVTQTINASCGTAQIPVTIVVPPKPVEVEVAFSTEPAVIYANTLATTGAVLTVTFDVNCVNPNIATPAALASVIRFTSSSPPPVARRGFVYTQSQGYVSFSSVQAVETTIDASLFGDVASPSTALSSPTMPLNQTPPMELHSITYSLTIVVAPNQLFNNYRKETVMIELTNDLLTPSLQGALPAFSLSNSTLAFTIFPNSRPLIDQAVMWLNFLTMTGFVIRTSSIVALQHSTSCIVDAGDSLDLTIHPLSFGIGSTDLTKFYLGGVLGNTALIIIAFVAQLVADSLFALKMEKGATGILDIDNPDSFKGLPTFPNWGIRMLMLLYPGLVLCGVRAVALGLTTTWLYIVMFLLAVICLGYPTVLFVGQRYYRPRWIENEALVPKTVDLLNSKSKVKSKVKSARRKIIEARERAAEDATIAVEGFFAKAMTPTGFYEVNHVDHVRFMASYLDYHGGLLFGSVLDNTFPLLYALCCLFPCPTNQVAGIFVTGLHAVYCLAFRPFVTIARVLVSLCVDIGCMIAIALLARDQEVQGTLTFQVVLIFVSWLNVVGYIWSFWRSERFRKFIRRKRRASRRSDKFAKSGPQTVGLKTRFLKVLENHLYHLHAMKPEVISRRNIRKRRMMMEDPSIVLESSSNSEMSEEELTTVTAIRQKASSPMAPRLAPAAPLPTSVAAMSPLAVAAVETKSDVPASVSSHSTSKTGNTSRLYRSTVSDNDSDENLNEEEENKIRLDAPDANTDEAKARRAFGENRFKAYIKTPDGKAFGRSDADSIVKKLVVSAEGVREVREWRDGTVQQQNEEMRKRTKVEADLKKLSANQVAMEVERAHRPVTARSAAKKDAEAIIEMTNRSRKFEDEAANRWEEAMVYEIKRAYRREGDTSTMLELDGGAGVETRRETFLQRRMRIMGASAPQGFDFDRGVDLAEI